MNGVPIKKIKNASCIHFHLFLMLTLRHNELRLGIKRKTENAASKDKCDGNLKSFLMV